MDAEFRLVTWLESSGLKKERKELSERQLFEDDLISAESGYEEARTR